MLQGPTFIESLSQIDVGDRRTGQALARWIDTVSALAFRYQKGSYDPFAPHTYWRGQAQPWTISPGMHRIVAETCPWGIGQQVAAYGIEPTIALYTEQILQGARAIALCPTGLPSLSDMQLLAFLQHQGAATPLIDFSTDVITALAMACFGAAHDDSDGVLIAYRFRAARANLHGGFSTTSKYSPQDAVVRFLAPYLTSRQSIQRGVFFYSNHVSCSINSSLNLPVVDCSEEISRYIYESHENGPDYDRAFPVPDGHAAAIAIPREHKPPIRDWLRAEFQIDEDYVYPVDLQHEVHRQFVNAWRVDKFRESDGMA